MSEDDRPPIRTTEERLLDTLADLRIQLENVRRYDFFIKNSNEGRQCTYAQKCKMLFFTVDYLETKKLMDQVHKLMEEVEKE